MSLSRRNICSLLPPAFLTFYPTQSFVVEAEVMGYFVPHHFTYSCLNFVVKATVRFYGPLKDADLIRQHQSVSSPSPGSRHTLIKAQEPPRTLCPRPFHLRRCGPIFNHYVNILQLALKLHRQTLNRSSHEDFELLSLHVRRTQTSPTEVKNMYFHINTGACFWTNGQRSTPSLKLSLHFG
jgi:hypothetical protein